jgi:hypothetical protein
MTRVEQRSVTMRRRPGLRSLVAVCSLGLLAPLVAPLVTGRVFVYNDLSWFHLPLRHLYRQALLAGDSVLWTPAVFAGFYLHGEGQIGLLHPLHLLLYRLLPLDAAFNLEIAASCLAAYGGMLWFLRRLRFGDVAALFGAMLFAFSGFNLLHHHHVNMVAVVAHLPWLLAAADVLIADERRHARTLAFAAMAVILGSEFLLGFPQAVWWNAIALAAFAVVRAAETGRWFQLLPCMGAVALGVMLGGIQLLPSADAAAHSMRTGMSRDFALTYSMHPFNLFQLWSPYFFRAGAHGDGDLMMFHEFGIYSGAILPVALIWVWIRREALGERRAMIAAATVFAAVTLLLALGRYGGVAAFLSYLPVLGSLRAPVRYIVLVQFALAILAAVTIDDLLAIAGGNRRAPRGPMAALWVPAALGIATTLALNGRLLFDGQAFAGVAPAAGGVAIVVAVTVLIFLAGRRQRWAIAGVIVVTAIDLGVWGIRFIYREPPRSIAELTQHIPRAPGNPADSYAVAAAGWPYLSNLFVMRGYRLSSGYVGLFPATRHAFDSEAARRLSGTRWIFTPDGARHPADGGVARVRLIDEQGRAASGQAWLAVDRPGRLVAQVAAPGRRVLAFTERFHDGWSATSDGGPLQTVRVEGDFLGCVLEAGDHRVSLRFMPRSFVFGSIVSAIGVALLAGVLLSRLR